ncbi:MAG: restriction endonuclease subunit R [Arcobacter sp.]|nr:MAG: restriction endonuclease subunit R [Arcobacter sp.]
MFTDLRNSLETGFINKSIQSNYMYLPKLITNNKKTKKKVLSTLINELHECDEFYFSVAFLTKSGIATLINTLEELGDKDIKGKILVSQYQNFTEPNALRDILKFKNIELKIATSGNFHAKGYIFKKGYHYSIMIGSSNLTANALCHNKEWNLLVSASNDSDIVDQIITEAEHEFDIAMVVTETFILDYEKIYQHQKKVDYEKLKLINNSTFNVEPNKMQKEALQNIKKIRDENKKSALLISATGTGKTYLSAFDVLEMNPKKFLFIVHRGQIAKKAMDSYKQIFPDKKMGLYSGKKKEVNSDFIFSTIQTLSIDKNLTQFNKEHFNYIVIDESHRIGADTYQRILNYFKPDFLLGMTATPERTDGFDIFKQFNYNLAYEIRLNKAMEEDMLCPFHYYGVSGISLKEKDNNISFSNLELKERVKKIILKADFYGCDNGIIRGLIFCRNIKEADELEKELNSNNLNTISLSGKDSQPDREKAIKRLESNNSSEKLDYIISVDIFNEGIDIPCVNQIIMLRPTQSAIIFVQQLGRGLRKLEGKEYLTIIDFIENYSSNYLIPIALYGDTSYDKDTVRKLMVSGSEILPGTSTINFDLISKERIFESINSSNFSLLKDLKNDYILLKYKIGKIPMMMDFIDHSSRAAKAYVSYSKSYFNFIKHLEDGYTEKVSEEESTLLELIGKNIANGKRVEEVILLEKLVNMENFSFTSLQDTISKSYDYLINESVIISLLSNLNFNFINKTLDIVTFKNGSFFISNYFSSMLNNKTFKTFLLDLLNYSLYDYNESFNKESFCSGFILYQKYSRQDVFRILNWEKNPNPQNVGGYLINREKKTCPIFVTYHKDNDISASTKYDDTFINNSKLSWMSKSRRKLSSPDVKSIKSDDLRLLLFIKKSDDEGSTFYYMGDVNPIENSFKQETIKTDNGENLPVVKLEFNLQHSVEESLYKYITTT